MKRYGDAMFDCETLSTTADAVILSIGAVRFDLMGDAVDSQGFYASISIDSNLDAGRKISEGTLQWWFQQGREAQQVFFEPKIALVQALEDLQDWVGGDKLQVWSNGADFDMPMLNHAYAQAGLTQPWAPYATRCYRTMKNVHGMVNPADKPPMLERSGVHHNALADAIDQAVHLQAIFRALRDPSTNKTPSLAKRMGVAA